MKHPPKNINLFIIVFFAVSIAIQLAMLAVLAISIYSRVVSTDRAMSIVLFMAALMNPLCAVYLLLLAFDVFHALWVWWRNRCWEKTITRDAEGLISGAAAYTLEGACPQAPRTAILFIHGFNDTPQAWQLLAPRVHELTRATCRVMRLPGIAEPLREQHKTSLEQWLNAIHIEVARLRTCHEKVFIAGHSLGGGLALLATRESFTLKVDGLILFSPLIRARKKHTRLFALTDRVLSFTKTCKTPFPNPIQTKDGRVYDYARDRYVSFAVFRAMFNMTRHLVASRDTCHKALVFVSERDRLIDTPAVARFLPNARIITTDKAGHALALDAGWEERAEEIARFVQS